MILGESLMLHKHSKPSYYLLNSIIILILFCYRKIFLEFWRDLSWIGLELLGLAWIGMILLDLAGFSGIWLEVLRRDNRRGILKR